MAIMEALSQLSVIKHPIVLDEEAFQKASDDLAEVAGKLEHLQKDIEEMLTELQKGFDTPAGHKFVNACQKTLLDTMEKQRKVILHVSDNLNAAKQTYESVFEEYRDLVNLINSD